jgi:hypothetical protein
MDGWDNPLKENAMDEVSRIGRTEFIAGPSQTTILPRQKRGGGTRDHKSKPAKDEQDMPVEEMEDSVEPRRLDLRM